MISVLVLEQVPELLSRVIGAWQEVQREEALLLGIFSVPCHTDFISSVLAGIQDNCKVTAERVA
jgi:hypothetical protein